MTKQTVHSKKHTIFRMFLIPLIAIMMLQSLLTLLTLTARRIFGTIQDHSVSMMARTVENRKVILENELIQRCTSVYRQENTMTGILKEYLEEQGLSLTEMLSSNERRQEFLTLIFPECLDNLQSTQTTGIFLILAGEDTDEAADYGGFFVRDSDPRVNTANNTDLLFERGSKELSRTFGVPLDTSWTTYFHMAGRGERRADAFFYEPLRAGREHPEADAVDLGYWSEPFLLEEDGNDSHEMIAYSIPLRYEGEVYGVLGIEISSSFLYDYFPMAELDENKQSGYLLALQDGDGGYRALLGKGILYNSVTADSDSFLLEDTGYDVLYQVADARLGSQGIYAVNCPLKLYDNFAPYEDVNWVLLGLNTEDELFGMSRRLYMWLAIAILAGLVFGVAGIYIVVLHLTRPIQNLMGCINGGSAGLEGFQASNILEIDALYGVIRDLSERQREAENVLLEEKERYRVALESTSDTFFTYDYQKQLLDIINHPAMNGVWECGEGIFPHINRVYHEDCAVVEGILKENSDEVYAEFRYKFYGKNEFEWYALYGKIVNDAEGKLYKLVGGLRNIQAQKKQEELQQERMQRDSVTGLYTYQTGRERMGQCRMKSPEGVMVYLLLGQLQELNESNGIVFGDMVLEEMGRVIKDRCVKMEQETGCQAIAVRVDGDEFAIWLEGMKRDQAETFVLGLLTALDGMFDREVLQLHILAGLAAGSAKTSSLELIRMAKLARSGHGENGAESCSFYEDLPAKKRKKLPVLEGKSVLSNDYGQEVNLASLALNLFGKGANLQAQMALILQKMGYHYGASDVLTTVIHADFHSNYLEYQWHRDAGNCANAIDQYTDGEWKAFQEWLGTEPVRAVTVEDSGRPALRKFLNIAEGRCGVVLPMYDSGNYMGNICILGLDMSLLQNAEEMQKLAEVGGVIQSQLNQQQHDLASRAKSEFLSRMSHEIRTPMNGIIGMTTIALQEDQDRERMRDCLNKIQDSSRYLLGLINDILDMSKIESGKMHLDFENFSLREMLDTIGELLRPQLEAKEIVFEQNVDIAHQWFNADKMRISQVLINLLGNAVKFTDRKGKIVLTVRESGEKDDLAEVYFAVQDNGIGIGKEDQERVFRSFEQAKGSAAASKQQGTGLGLSISTRLVQMMGGNIELESELGKGSCFSFTIGLRPGREVTETAGENEKLSFENCHALLVEDNELNIEIAKYLLEDCGFVVDCAYNGAEAVERIKTTAPGTYDVVLMDIMMPVMNGLDATRAIRQLDREDCRTLPIIAMSANAFDDDMKKSVECGMNGHLTKPVEVDKLYKTLGEIIRPGS